jgi:hypothetical protein
VSIFATIRVQSRTNSDAYDFAQKIEIEVRESNDGVHIRTIYPDNKFPVIRIGGRTSYSVDYDIAMPADANPNGDIFGGWLLAQMLEWHRLQALRLVALGLLVAGLWRFSNDRAALRERRRFRICAL